MKILHIILLKNISSVVIKVMRCLRANRAILLVSLNISNLFQLKILGVYIYRGNRNQIRFSLNISLKKLD